MHGDRLVRGGTRSVRVTALDGSWPVWDDNDLAGRERDRSYRSAGDVELSGELPATRWCRPPSSGCHRRVGRPRHRLRSYGGLARVMAMSAAEHLPLADVKNRLSEVIERLEREHGRVVVTKHGRPAAVMLSIDDLESLEETLEIMSNPKLLAEIRQGDRDVKAGRTERLSKDDVLARRGEK